MKIEQSHIHIQGYPGSFHDEVASNYFKEQSNLKCYDSFREQANGFKESNSNDFAVMAIENSIAGSILQNYKLIQENQFSIVGETYLRIEMNFMALGGSKLNDIEIVRSHPMALYQCQNFLSKFQFKQHEAEDTAKSAKEIQDNNLEHVATIASRKAASIYNLEIIEEGIQDNQLNYTRFFILSTQSFPQTGNKASISCTLPHSKGSLAQVLQYFSSQEINLSKIQSYPILGKPNHYKFYIDLEFSEQRTSNEVNHLLENQTVEHALLGLYTKAGPDTNS